MDGALQPSTMNHEDGTEQVPLLQLLRMMQRIPPCRSLSQNDIRELSNPHSQAHRTEEMGKARRLNCLLARFENLP